MTIASFPKMDDGSRNPYLFLLKNSLEKNKLKIESSNPNHLSFKWLIKNRKKVSILHLHWIQYHYINIDKKRLSVRLLLNFILNLFVARIMSYKIVWTMHNVHPHENKYPVIDFLIRLVLTKLTNAIITHCNYGKEYLLKKYKRKENVAVIHHPNYINVYPDRISRESARQKLGIPLGSLVFLFLGEIRNYKGLNSLIETFKAYKNNNSHLIIAGHPLFSWTENELVKLINNDRRIIANFMFIPDNDLQVYFKASDVMILPFTNITMSGSLLLGMSFGKPIVAPAIGGINEYIKDDSGILYYPGDTKNLLEALQKCENQDLSGMGYNGYQSVKNYTWDNLAEKIIQIYTSFMKEKKTI